MLTSAVLPAGTNLRWRQPPRGNQRRRSFHLNRQQGPRSRPGRLAGRRTQGKGYLRQIILIIATLK
jgi:hypothetical protein